MQVGLPGMVEVYGFAIAFFHSVIFTIRKHHVKRNVPTEFVEGDSVTSASQITNAHIRCEVHVVDSLILQVSLDVRLGRKRSHVRLFVASDSNTFFGGDEAHHEN